MKLGVISDIHANLPALEAVLSELDAHDVDEVVCLGDIIGVLGRPNKVVSLVRSRAAHTVYGNHDARIFPRRDWMPVHDFEVEEYEHSRETLTDDNFDWLIALPGVLTVYDDVTLAHSRPDPDSPAGTETGDSGIRSKESVGVGGEYLDGGILLVGHTHHQHAVALDKFDGQSGLLLNPGSVGFPFNHDSDYTDESVGKASFAVLDTDTHEYELLTVEYDSSPVLSYLADNGLLLD